MNWNNNFDLHLSAMEDIPIFAVIIDAQGKVLKMNEVMLRALSYSLDEVKGKDFLTTFVPPDERGSLAAVFKKILELYESTVNDNHILTRDGSRLLVEWRGKPLINPDHSLDYFYGLGIDVTVQRHTYLDVTTYAFESTRWGELRMFGFSKDHKNNEVQVVMALLLDNNGIPITYELFPGNTMDQNTLVESVEKLKNIYHLDKITVVADRGMNGGANLVYLDKSGYDFVISYTLKRSTDAFKELVFQTDGWQDTWDDQHKELVYREKTVRQALKVKVPISQEAIQETDKKKRGRPRKYETVEIPVKIHLTWSAKRAHKDKRDRERILERLKKRLDKPYQLKASIKRGCNQYLQMAVDTKNWTLDEEKIQQAERFDGYYAIVTNNLDLSTEQVCQTYRGIWKIEESFRILKTDLRACPVFVWNDDYIKGHFMMCFISLCLLRYIQYLLETQYETRASAEVIMEAIREPLALVQGDYPHNVVTPTKISKTYLELARLIKLPALRTNMTLTQFRSSTKLDLNINLK